ncbi:MAG TPA: hypothetical protein VGH15_11485 [Caulobacteraceae bacterium]
MSAPGSGYVFTASRIRAIMGWTGSRIRQALSCAWAWSGAPLSIYLPLGEVETRL